MELYAWTCSIIGSKNARVFPLPRKMAQYMHKAISSKHDNEFIMGIVYVKPAAITIIQRKHYK